MGKPRIVVTCPRTGVTVISNFVYEDVAGPNNKTVLFACVCGETHRVIYAGRHGDRFGDRYSDRRNALPLSPPPDNNRAS